MPTDKSNGVFDFSLALNGMYKVPEYYSKQLAEKYPNLFFEFELPEGVVPNNLVKDRLVDGKKEYYYETNGEEFLCVLQQKGTTVKDKEKRQKKMVVPYPVPRPAEFKSTKPSGADAALAKAKEALGDSSGLDATVDPGDASWNDKVDETEKVLAEAQGKTDAMNETYNAALESAGGDDTKAMLALEPDSQAGIDTWVPNLSSVKAAVENTNG